MAKLTIRYPSKQVQYGFVEVEVEFADGMSPEELGQQYVNLVFDYWKGETAALAALQGGGGVTTPTPAPKTASAPEESAAELLIKEELDATVVEVLPGTGAPWEGPPPAARPKPWEQGGTALKPAAIDWS